MKYNTNLPKELNEYLEEIYNNEKLKDAFEECDVEIFEPEEIKELTEDESWLEDFDGGEPNYDAKPFAQDQTGGLWVILNDKQIGYIGTEGECGIVARNIKEFMNIVSTLKSGYIKDLKDEKNFIETFKEQNEEFENKKIINKFIEKHEFEKEPSKIYELLKLGMTTKPFFVIKSTDEDHTDSYSLLGSDDGQESLEKFMKEYL